MKRRRPPNKTLDQAMLNAFEQAAARAIPALVSQRQLDDGAEPAARLVHAYEAGGIRPALAIFEELDNLDDQLAVLRPLLVRDPGLGLELMANFSVDDADWRTLKEQMKTAQYRKKGREFSETAHFALPARQGSTFPVLADWNTSYGDGNHNNYSYRFPDGLSYYIFQTNNERGHHVGYTLSRTNQAGLNLPVSGLWATITENGGEAPSSTVQTPYRSPQKAHAAARKHYFWVVDRRPQAETPERHAEALPESEHRQKPRIRQERIEPVTDRARPKASAQRTVDAAPAAPDPLVEAANRALARARRR